MSKSKLSEVTRIARDIAFWLRLAILLGLVGTLIFRGLFITESIIKEWQIWIEMLFTFG